MKIYHWTDINGNSAYYTSKREAEAAYNRLSKVDDPGIWCETDAIELLERMDMDLKEQETVTTALSGRLNRLTSEDVSDIQEAARESFRRNYRDHFIKPRSVGTDS